MSLKAWIVWSCILLVLCVKVSKTENPETQIDNPNHATAEVDEISDLMFLELKVFVNTDTAFDDMVLIKFVTSSLGNPKNLKINEETTAKVFFTYEMMANRTKLHESLHSQKSPAEENDLFDTLLNIYLNESDLGGLNTILMNIPLTMFASELFNNIFELETPVYKDNETMVLGTFQSHKNNPEAMDIEVKIEIIPNLHHLDLEIFPEVLESEDSTLPKEKSFLWIQTHDDSVIIDLYSRQIANQTSPEDDMGLMHIVISMYPFAQTFIIIIDWRLIRKWIHFMQLFLYGTKLIYYILTFSLVIYCLEEYFQGNI
ncbi:uncharacterized protein [Halyomorpha halys]|uniref:uncharacterized protein n=1 Tax=Halyomorpha halys TaxID=286706 RepID=UPI0006D502D5|nr:uncharacterized protein LOC106680155 [Halyomorpha halys]XP_014275152.1 uncharacterized protein LOC106680155 [Halyomorpha halys]